MQALKYVHIIKDMGPKYFWYRLLHMINIKSKHLKHINSFDATTSFPITIKEWRSSSLKYIIESRSSIRIPKVQDPNLKTKVHKILNGEILYFNANFYPTPAANKWHTNPINKQVIAADKHWLDLDDFAEGNDIKFVWERSRFCYLYDIIRFDYHFDTDCSNFVLSEITGWIDENPLHLGPNYISAQEVSIRLVNWLFALNYYSDCEQITEEIWQKIMSSIYDQLKHVAINLDFSQKLVRNNHIVTEAAALFVYSTLFPILPESKKWQQKSKQILEAEGLFQIFSDGSYLQYSMNYHRIILQAYNLVLNIASLNAITFSEALKTRLKKSLQFLITCTNSKTGKLPNYGANDGSLIFPLNNNDYSDFRPQIQSLSHALALECFKEITFEDTFWLNGNKSHAYSLLTITQPINKYSDGGYYLFNESNTLTFIRCGKHKSRPSQADNLHIDLWFNEKNIMRDCGTYLYNTDPETTKYFFGTASHNTVMLEDFDQMLKGPRFLWFFHSKFIKSTVEETEQSYIFTGSIKAFRQSGKWHLHERKVEKIKSKPEWIITDKLDHAPNMNIHQIWHPDNSFFDDFDIAATDESNRTIPYTINDMWYSPSYSIKVKSKQIKFSTKSNIIKTRITHKQ